MALDLKKQVQGVSDDRIVVLNREEWLQAVLACGPAADEQQERKLSDLRKGSEDSAARSVGVRAGDIRLVMSLTPGAEQTTAPADPAAAPSEEAASEAPTDEFETLQE